MSSALEETAPSCERKYKRLTDPDRSYILALRKQNLTQAQIAQRIGCTQQAVSDWLRQCQDTTTDATLYLRGRALSLARKVAESKDDRVLVRVLEGVNALDRDEKQQGLTVIVGNGGNVQIGVLVSPPSLEVVGEGVENP